MTKSILAWGLRVLLMAAMIIVVAGCGNDGPSAPPTDSVVKDYGSGDLGDKELTDLMYQYDALKQAGGGTTSFDPHSRTLIGVSDRWMGSTVQGIVLVQEANGTVSSHAANSAIVLADLHYPITVSVWADNYVNQTIYRTNANIIAICLERSTTTGANSMIYGIMGPGSDLIGPDTFWQTFCQSTQDTLDSDQRIGKPGSYIYTILNVNPWRPVGAVTWLYTKTVAGTPVTQPGGTSPTGYSLAGYAYDNLGMFFPGGLGTWVMTLDPVDEFNTYDPGNFTIPFNGTTGITTTALVQMSAGVTIADTMEFVPTSPPTVPVPAYKNGVYSVETVDSPITGDREVVRGRAFFGQYGTEEVFAPWDSSDSGLPNLTFSVPPTLKNIKYVQGQNFIAPKWVNVPATGLLELTFSINGKPVWIVYLNKDETEIPENDLVISPAVATIYRNLEANLIRVSCPGVSLDDFDATRVWGGVTSMASSPGAHFTSTSSLD